MNILFVSHEDKLFGASKSLINLIDEFFNTICITGQNLCITGYNNLLFKFIKIQKVFNFWGIL